MSAPFVAGARNEQLALSQPKWYCLALFASSGLAYCRRGQGFGLKGLSITKSPLHLKNKGLCIVAEPANQVTVVCATMLSHVTPFINDDPMVKDFEGTCGGLLSNHRGHLTEMSHEPN